MKQIGEAALRQEAIRRYLCGESPVAIYTDLNRSKPLFFKWLRRYQRGDTDWFQDRSHRPDCHPRQTGTAIEHVVATIRRQLPETSYAQIGAAAIQWEMKKLGFEPLPVWTINRILKRQGLIQPRTRRQPSGIDCPSFGLDIPNSLHQMDIVGPRYIHGDGRLYSHNLIDAYSHQVSLYPSRFKDDTAAVGALIKAWQRIGIPDFLQLDNALCYRGSNRWPRSFGLVIRFCLSLGVQPAFIPIGEPWRQGVIERFNQVYNHQFYRRQRFADYRSLCEASAAFERFHNQHHRYSTTGGKTPDQVVAEDGWRSYLLASDYQRPKDKIPLVEGTIHLIRFIRSDCMLRVFGEAFRLRTTPIYEYVIATISVEAHAIRIMLKNELVEEIEYHMPVDW